MAILKKTLIGVGIGTAILVAGYYSALLSLPKIVDLNKYKEQVCTQIERQSGFKVNCENIYFERSLTPYLKIHLYHTVVLYPNDEIFLKLKESDLKVKILPLIFKKIEIKDAKLTRPIINVTLYKDFSTSIEKYLSKDKKFNTSGFYLNGDITDTFCKDYKVNITDETTGKTFYLEGEELNLKDIKINERAHLILKGALFENKIEYLKYDLDIIAPLNSEKQQFKFSPFKTIYESKIKGNVTGKLQISKTGALDGNLNIENLALKFEDIILKDNSLKMEFKGEEAQIKALLHTSQKDKADIYGKFNYGKKKYIDLNTNAKNINLKNLFKIISALSESLNIENPVKDLKINGILDADFRINSDFKKLKSSGSAKIINADIVHEKLPYKITKINSDINMDNNKIYIEKAQAYVNSTPINVFGDISEDMSMNITAKSENLELKNIIKLFDLEKNIPVKIQNGKLSFKSDITGVINKSIKAQTNAQLTNLTLYDEKNKLPLSAEHTNINLNSENEKYTGDIKLIGLKTKINKNELKSNDFNITFDDKKIQIQKSTIQLLNSALEITGDIENYAKSPEVKVNFKGGIKSSDLAQIISEYVKEPYKALGTLQTQGIVAVKENKPEISILMRANSNNYLSYAVIKELLNKPSLLKIDIGAKNNDYTIKNITLYEDNPSIKNEDKLNKIITISGGITSAGKDFIMRDIKVQIPNTLSGASNFFGGEEFSIKADITANNTIKEPKLQGDIKLYSYNLKKYLTAVKNADITITPENIRIIAPDVQINTSKINLLADINPNIKDKIIVENVQMNCANLDLNSMYPIIEKNVSPFTQSIITVKKGTATINKFQVMDLKARDISSDFTVEKNILKIRNILSTAYYGSVSGDINYDIPHSRLEIMLKGQNISLKESLYDLCKLSDNIAGTADFESSLSLIIGEYGNVIKSLSGKVDFNARNGRMGTLGRFEYYLNAQNILYRGILNTTINQIANALSKDNTAHYQSAVGTLMFQNGYIITNEIKTTGKNMSLYIIGRHNILTNLVNIDIYGRISESIRRKLGSFGDVSISELISGNTSHKQNNVLIIKKEIIDKIPPLYNQGDFETNTFKVNVFGNINSLNAINSFMWILPKTSPIENQPQNEAEDEKLPDFSDL